MLQSGRGGGALGTLAQAALLDRDQRVEGDAPASWGPRTASIPLRTVRSPPSSIATVRRAGGASSGPTSCFARRTRSIASLRSAAVTRRSAPARTTARLAARMMAFLISPPTRPSERRARSAASRPRAARQTRGQKLLPEPPPRRLVGRGHLDVGEDAAHERAVEVAREIRGEHDDACERVELLEHDRARDVDAVVGGLGHVRHPAPEDGVRLVEETAPRRPPAHDGTRRRRSWASPRRTWTRSPRSRPRRSAGRGGRRSPPRRASCPSRGARRG
jgi:hypothetical protein